MSQLIDPTLRAAAQSLNLRLQAQNVHASNVANADTPNYKGQAVEFEQAMRSAMANEGKGIKLEVSDPKHIGSPPPEAVEAQVFDDPNGIESLDGNTVDRAKEMVAMKENQILYNTAVEAIRKKLGMLEYGINEGGGNR